MIIIPDSTLSFRQVFIGNQSKVTSKEWGPEASQTKLSLVSGERMGFIAPILLEDHLKTL